MAPKKQKGKAQANGGDQPTSKQQKRGKHSQWSKECGPSGKSQEGLLRELDEGIRKAEDEITNARPSAEDLEEAVKKAVRTSVLRSKDKLGPMTRAELVGRIGLSSKACELAISYAKRRLVGTFGLELVETTKVTPESSKKTTGQRVLIVRSALPQGLLEGVEAADDGLNAFRGLGYTIGQFIAHDGEGEGMNEQAMWDLLRRLGIRQEDKDHPTFGSVKDAVEKLFKNRWLVRTGTSGQDTSGNKVQIGEALLGLVSPDGSHEEGIKALREHAKSIQISPQEAAGRDDDDGGEECDDDGGGEVIEIE